MTSKSDDGNGGKQAETVEVKGRPFHCGVCQHDHFYQRHAQFHGGVATFLKLEWASPTCTHPERPLQHEEEFVLVLDGPRLSVRQVQTVDLVERGKDPFIAVRVLATIISDAAREGIQNSGAIGRRQFLD